MGHGAWGIGHGAWGIGHWAWGMGHWAWGIGHWALGIGHWVMLRGETWCNPRMILYDVIGHRELVDAQRRELV
ncbi:hypothetical protein G7B40_006870 [Aetokthonos hydrillicola Thurmond2011]|uniref:Uncharacterized protein n=1 Tax=Aetokthonos hydrillicola Thurmond2011 TaxID=2712845 RepID=A0AAP5I5R4_9CYAN|nr:hypothetical protein [Aetokthonos hydrillicola]MDR9894294.1 hypothetical protein [Aetokthonos hydrillicola Thurmond2011]